MDKLRDSTLPIEERARDAVSRMTLEEKVSQLMYDSAGIERLGIPPYHWWNECLHGVARCGVATVFPQAIGMAAMFDEALMFEVATAISDEIRGKYNDYQSIGDRGIYKGLTHYAPNINLFRDPRWGRGHETYGEDPFLTARMGVAFIRGIQGDETCKYRKADANVKHYVVHSGPERLRHEIDVKIGPKEFRETYLYAFAQCIREARVACVMGAYNRVNGAPCSGSRYLMHDLLRGELGFEGFTVSDSFAIDDFHLHHKITASPVESAALAFSSGCEQNGGTTYRHLTEAVRNGLVREADIDGAVARLLGERIRLGMFDSFDEVPYNTISPDVVDCSAHRALAKKAAEKSIVLLKNDGALPLSKGVRSLAVIGPNADSREVLLGNYAGTMSRYTTLLEGIRRRAELEGIKVRYAEGCHLYKGVRPLTEADLIPEAVLAARKSDAVVLCLGLAPMLEGEESDDPSLVQFDDRTDLGLPGRQSELLRRVAEVGKPVIVVLTNGGPLSIPDEDPLCNAILEAWYPGEEGGAALADILFGDASPSGRMPVTTVARESDLPPIEEYAMAGRTYRFLEKDPLYPFGFGLSYARFRYEIQGFPAELPVGAPLSFIARVSNESDFGADAALQAYLSDEEASVRVPVRQLVWFRRLFLEAKETRDVNVEIPARLMVAVMEDGSVKIEPGRFKFSFGGVQPDSVSRRLSQDPVVTARFSLMGVPLTVPY
jgi:beta-glucosidase